MRKSFRTQLRKAVLNPKLLFWAGILFILYSLIFDRGMGFIRQYQLWQENQELQAKIEKAEQRNEHLEEERQLLETDLERIKQEAIKNGYAEPDEIIVQFR